MDELIALLKNMDNSSEEIHKMKHKASREAAISKDNVLRLEILTRLCELYKDGALQKANELLKNNK